MPDRLPTDCRDAAAILNRDCVCRSVDHDLLRHALAGEFGEGGDEARQIASTRVRHPVSELFSDTRVYVAEAHLRFMAELIAAIERVVALPAWHERVLAHAPAIARHEPRCPGVFLGYDFHLGDDGPQLIEINTNAGGGLLNARLLRAQRACCDASDARPVSSEPEEAFLAMFRNAWQQARGVAPLRGIAIVDEAPEAQFLASEFELFRQLFEAHGIAAVITDPQHLSLVDGQLRCGSQVIDLVYNRLTDFALDDPRNAVLRAAYLADAVLLTPHPRAHALYADKRNLVVLSDPAWLQANGVSAADQALLQAGVPRTAEVLPAHAASFWSSRKQWFFKPAAGYGSKATYRGDKLTRRVFEEISRGGYIAQALVRPSERRLWIDGAEQNLKLDLRNYVYQGLVQLVSARLYQGQTTNFRTPGGGFAAVFSVPCQREKRHCTRPLSGNITPCP